MNTDIAFAGQKAYVGNYAGFAIYDVGDPANPRMISQVSCPDKRTDSAGRVELSELNVQTQPAFWGDAFVSGVAQVDDRSICTGGCNSW